ncbi:MAG: sulfurtransferase [Pseudonocardiaceae bacterium]|nr:sulfurtransferase [Pseudonocardiaceae bacterium]
MDPLIAPDRLAESLASATPPTVLDVRWRLTGPPGRADYDAGHLPGAVFLDVDSDLASRPGPIDHPGRGGRHPLPDPVALQRVLRSAGVRGGVPVVAYDDADGSVAARAWWLLRWAGHPRVAVLDGGYREWVARSLPVTSELPAPPPGTFTVRPGGMPVVDAEQAAALARNGALLDARAQPRYRGEVEPVDPRAGHIPGARSAPFSALSDTDGRWLPPARLAELATTWGVGGGVPVAAYCGSGVTSCALVLALEVAGVTTPQAPAALYPGSWSQWCADPARPIATGAAPG